MTTTIKSITVYPHGEEEATLFELTGCNAWTADSIEQLRQGSCPTASEAGRRARIEFQDADSFEFDADENGWAPGTGFHAEIRHDFAWLDEAIEELQRSF